MASFNKVILMGNLTRDPELKQAPSGAKVADLGLAVSETWRDKNGQPKEVTCFVDVVVWDKLAELCQQYLVKGRPVLVEGRLQMDEWTDKQTNEKRSKLRVRADTVKFLGTPPKPGEAHAAAPASTHAAAAAPAPSAGEDAPGDLSHDEDNVPF